MTLSSGFAECQLLVMTPVLFEQALMHAKVTMADLALLIIDGVREWLRARVRTAPQSACGVA